MDRARSKRIGPDRGILLPPPQRCVNNLWKQLGKPSQLPDAPIICRNSREQATARHFAARYKYMPGNIYNYSPMS